MSFLRDEGPDAGRELAWVMAEALAACERYAGALAHLDAARATGFGRKDALENAYHDAVCSGTLNLAAAQRRMARNWLRYSPKTPASSPAAQSKPPASSSTSPSGHVTCSQFASHAQAQSYFEAHRDTAANLDRDGDGRACESLR